MHRSRGIARDVGGYRYVDISGLCVVDSFEFGDSGSV